MDYSLHGDHVAALFCPKCGQGVFVLDPYQVALDGIITPEWTCPTSDCDYRATIRLDRWLHELTPAENAVLKNLASVWGEYLALPMQHPLHTQEFMFSIHALQRIVMCRVVERQMGSVFNGEDVGSTAAGG